MRRLTRRRKHYDVAPTGMLLLMTDLSVVWRLMGDELLLKGGVADDSGYIGVGAPPPPRSYDPIWGWSPWWSMGSDLRLSGSFFFESGKGLDEW